MIGDIVNGVCPVHGLIGGTDKHLGFDHERRVHICLTCIRDRAHKLEAALNEGQPCAICNHIDRANKLEDENKALRNLLMKRYRMSDLEVNILMLDYAEDSK